MQINISDGTTANAGPNDTVCANNAVAGLSGTVLVATGGYWLSSGTGVFADSSSLVTTYTASLADTSAGIVDITLITTGNGTCIADTDSMVIVIDPAPYVQAGPDQIVCANNALVSLSGSVINGTTTGYWTTLGSGVFADSSDLGTTYTPSAADTASGFVQLILRSTNNGLCFSVRDTMEITITPAPFVDAGPNAAVCGNNSDVTLSGNIANTSGTGFWSTLGSGVFDDSTDIAFHEFNAKIN